MSLINKYNELEPSEQRALSIGLIAIIGFMLYQFIYTPLQIKQQKLSAQLTYQRQLNHWLTSIENQLTGSQTKSKLALEKSQLLSTTDQSIKQSAIQPFSYQLQQMGSDGVLLSFDKVPYSLFIKWLAHFCLKYPLKIDEVSISKTAITGEVSIKLQLTLFET